MSLTTFILYTLLFCFHLPICSARDALTLNDRCISEDQTLISAGKRFELGFFERSGHKRFVGIWYYRSKPRIFVWVGNRDKALVDKTSRFCLAANGLAIVSENSNITLTSDAGEMVKLFDSGNLALIKEGTERSGSFTVVWQSFSHPTDTFLPGMKMDEKLKLISWKSRDDPASGNFTFQLDQERQNQYIINNENSNPHWKSGLSGKFINDDIHPSVSFLLSNFTTRISKKKDFVLRDHSFDYSKINYQNYNARLVMNFSGEIQYFARRNESAPWLKNWWEPRDNCSVFKLCGVFASCSSNRKFLCKCLPGFKPVSPEGWKSEDFSEGCISETPCSKAGEGNFLRLEKLKLGKPDRNFNAEDKNECERECLKGCSCQAYSFETTKSRGSPGNATCWIWTDYLNNIEEYTDGGHDILLRVQNKTGISLLASVSNKIEILQVEISIDCYA